MGGEHERDDALGAVGERCVDRVRDPGVPVLHAHEHGEARLLLESGTLSLGDLVERRAPADAAIALGQRLDRLRPNGPAAADVLEVGGDVLRAAPGSRRP